MSEREIKPVEDNWQLIETAPKDGTAILIGWFEFPRQRSMTAAYWHSTKKCWVNTWMAFSADANDQPTHWLPLPDPPKI